MKILLMTIVIMFVLTGCCKVMYTPLDADDKKSKEKAVAMITNYLDSTRGISTYYADRPLSIRLDRKTIKLLKKKSDESIRLFHGAYVENHCDHPERKKDSATVIIQMVSVKAGKKVYKYADFRDFQFARCQAMKLTPEPPIGICPPPRNCILDQLESDR